MYRYLCLLLLCGCVTKHNPQPSDTKFKDRQRNWLETYRAEIKLAIKNEDREAYYFFMQEIVKEHYKQETGQDMDPNPSLRFINNP